MCFPYQNSAHEYADDQSDYFSSTSNTWLTEKERIALAQIAAEEQEKKERRERQRFMTIDLTKGVLIEEPKKSAYEEEALSPEESLSSGQEDSPTVRMAFNQQLTVPDESAYPEDQFGEGTVI